MSEEHHANGKFMAGFFLGGLIGAILLFFMGTKEGKKAGKVLERKGQDILEDLESKLEDLEQKGRQVIKQGQEVKQDVLDTLAEKKDDMTDMATERLDDALAKIEDLQEKSRETTASIRKMFKNTPKKRS